MSANPIRPRDINGWRMPREGTKSRRIYDLLLEGKTPKEIHVEIGGSINTLRVLIWMMRNPGQANHNRLKPPADQVA